MQKIYAWRRCFACTRYYTYRTRVYDKETTYMRNLQMLTVTNGINFIVSKRRSRRQKDWDWRLVINLNKKKIAKIRMFSIGNRAKHSDAEIGQSGITYLTIDIVMGKIGKDVLNNNTDANILGRRGKFTIKKHSLDYMKTMLCMWKWGLRHPIFTIWICQRVNKDCYWNFRRIATFLRTACSIYIWDNFASN